VQPAEGLALLGQVPTWGIPKGASALLGVLAQRPETGPKEVLHLAQGSTCPRMKKTKASSPLYGFGSSERRRAGSFTSVTPGPGSYVPNYQATKHDTPKYSAAGRNGARSMSGTPGPGSYHTEVPASPGKASPEWGFGTAPRQKHTGNFTPGPGTYIQKDNMGDGTPKFTMRSKSEHAFSRSEAAGIGNAYTQFGY